VREDLDAICKGSTSCSTSVYGPGRSLWHVFWGSLDNNPENETLVIYCDEEWYRDEGNHYLHEGATVSDVIERIRTEYKRCNDTER